MILDAAHEELLTRAAERLAAAYGAGDPDAVALRALVEGTASGATASDDGLARVVDAAKAGRAVYVYADGSCAGNGTDTTSMGAAFCVVVDEERLLSRARPLGPGTNQVAEIVAATDGLAVLPDGAVACVRTDSSYVIGTMTQGWKRRVNHAQWDALDRQVKRLASVRWEHVKGHSGDRHNEHVDTLAVRASKGETIDA